MQCTSYFSHPSEQALLALQVREAELRVAREELAFLQACGGAGEDDVRRLRAGLGMAAVKEERPDAVVVVGEDDNAVEKVASAGGPLVSLKSILAPLMIATDASVSRLCRRVRPVLERHGMPTYKRRKAVHVLSSDAARVAEVAAGVICADG
jgi:hypothetical protein